MTTSIFHYLKMLHRVLVSHRVDNCPYYLFQSSYFSRWHSDSKHGTQRILIMFEFNRECGFLTSAIYCVDIIFDIVKSAESIVR